VFTNKNGYLYSFTGLRGDAKALYKKIKEGTERRVELVKCPSVKLQQRYVNEADLVIWATGYQTNPI
jgi:lysine/ornithine N-monooxygenase